MTNNDTVNKDEHYGQYRKWENTRHAMGKKAIHKALDMMPDDDNMQIDARRTEGMGWKELAIIAGAGLTSLGVLTTGGIGTAAIAAALYLSSGPGTQTETIQQHQPPTDSEYEVRFWDGDGNPIQIPHVSTRKD